MRTMRTMDVARRKLLDMKLKQTFATTHKHLLIAFFLFFFFGSWCASIDIFVVFSSQFSPSLMNHKIKVYGCRLGSLVSTTNQMIFGIQFVPKVSFSIQRHAPCRHIRAIPDARKDTHPHARAPNRQNIDVRRAKDASIEKLSILIFNLIFRATSASNKCYIFGTSSTEQSGVH